jgi:hypothetical protein
LIPLPSDRLKRGQNKKKRWLTKQLHHTNAFSLALALLIHNKQLL